MAVGAGAYRAGGNATAAWTPVRLRGTLSTRRGEGQQGPRLRSIGSGWISTMTGWTSTLTRWISMITGWIPTRSRQRMAGSCWNDHPSNTTPLPCTSTAARCRCRPAAPAAGLLTRLHQLPPLLGDPTDTSCTGRKSSWERSSPSWAPRSCPAPAGPRPSLR
jgi:hypothetical protein